MASADHNAAKTQPEQLKILEDKEYLYEQVFNADKTDLYQKCLPSRTYISKAECSAPGFKAAKDHVILLMQHDVW